MDIYQYLKLLKQRGLMSMVDGLQAIMSKYPDVALIDNKISAASANPEVDEIDVAYGDNISVDVFVMKYGLKLYANPATIVLGKTNPHGFGYIIDQSWETLLDMVKMNPVVTKRIRDLAFKHKPVDY